MAKRAAGSCLLTEYAKDHGLMPRMRFNSTVVGMARRNSGVPGWLLEIRTSDGNVTREEFDFVAVCTGQFNEPQTISHPGEDAFKAAGGKILHSAQHTDASIVKGEKVVVLGGSKSATDIAVNSVDAGASEVVDCGTVFPGHEIAQSTIIERENFLSWKVCRFECVLPRCSCCL